MISATPELDNDRGSIAMWDTVGDDKRTGPLSHDLLCCRCGHAMHTFLACSDTCDCVPAAMPGAAHRLAG